MAKRIVRSIETDGAQRREGRHHPVPPAARAGAHTTVARLNAVALPADRDLTPMFRLIVDSASAIDLLACLLDAAAASQGGLIGLAALV